MVYVNISTHSGVSLSMGSVESISMLRIDLNQPPNSTSFFVVRTGNTFKNQDWPDSIRVCMETKLSPVTFVHLIGRIMGGLCSWN